MRKDILKYTQNRELSWLKFNQRVLEEAQDPSVPLLERMKFVAIFTSNLDEFFMIRVGSLFDMAAADPKAVDSRSGMTPSQQLEKFTRQWRLFIKKEIKLTRKLRSSFILMGCAVWILKSWNKVRKSM